MTKTTAFFCGGEVSLGLGGEKNKKKKTKTPAIGRDQICGESGRKAAVTMNCDKKRRDLTAHEKGYKGKVLRRGGAR